MIKGIFGSVIPLLEKTLNIRMMRHDVISSNIANEETPGYKARDVEFQHELANAIDNRVQMVSTHKNHVSALDMNLSPKLVIRNDTKAGLDNNTVSLEKEMVNLAENTMLYNAEVTILSKKFQAIRDTIKEAR
ncbi:MAG: flagellar basal body rod protein FlgB [Deltaproteobacteria bacterium]|nr:flagellar basal body rod protein FlgB [Deltaproteobacteria bacterium]